MSGDISNWPGATAPAQAPAAPVGGKIATEAASEGLLERVKINPDGSVSIKLFKPVAAHTSTGQLAVLELRAPTLLDFTTYGDPISLPAGKSFEDMSLVDYKPGPKFMEWISALSGHDIGVLGRLSMADARLVCFAVFFSSLSGASS